MTRQEEINKMAKEVATYFASDEDVQAAFRDVLIRGAEWADAHPHWISVEEELPPCDQSLYDRHGKPLDYAIKVSKSVLVYANGELSINCLNQDIEYGKPYGKPYWTLPVTHWMPMPQVPILSNSSNIGKDLKGDEE